MSASEIADNKWELQASKPPVSDVGGILQIIVVGAFTLMFAWMMLFTFQGIFGSKRESLADQYGNLTVDGKKKEAAPAAPAAE
ncbi:hypothetical protein OV090_18315 [Nannocystis sp. RBIL2]|uniref:hypothetical protein n=1 Tax=Nannocystis sp. RBIL2 TaxID=2996788 RepID=UPI00226E8E0E|nr:hypothetical protein [Nannocystis sp. RBIL2]MCY1066735.1 hypothetical protein [Nannocystis sp. RBIL2]